MKQDVVVVIGAGGIGMAIARRQGFGKQIVLADFNEKLLAAAAKELESASYKVTTLKVDVSWRASVRTLADAAVALGPESTSSIPLGSHPTWLRLIECSPSICTAAPSSLRNSNASLLREAPD